MNNQYTNKTLTVLAILQIIIQIILLYSLKIWNLHLKDKKKRKRNILIHITTQFPLDKNNFIHLQSYLLL